MDPSRFHEITSRYARLRIAVLGDFCLDRYLEIDAAKSEVSIETGLPVHNVVNVRAQAGGAGTIVNNLAALGVSKIYPIGFAGQDGEGVELARALEKLPGVRLNHFIQTPLRRTFTYTKPLLISPGQPPTELNRLDFKNWTHTPELLQEQFLNHLTACAARVDAIIVLEQVTLPETGVVTQKIAQALTTLAEQNGKLFILADSRRGPTAFPRLNLKMNVSELLGLSGQTTTSSVETVQEAAVSLARQQEHTVFVTLAERGMLGALPNGESVQVGARRVRGPIDIVGAGDAVSANLTAAISAGAILREALELASSAASVVIHKLGTTGTANLAEIEELVKKG